MTINSVEGVTLSHHGPSPKAASTVARPSGPFHRRISIPSLTLTYRP